jgi:hypothetical protein
LLTGTGAQRHRLTSGGRTTFETKPILPDDHAIAPGNLKITDRVRDRVDANPGKVAAWLK